jgi:hypothetical protein
MIAIDASAMAIPAAMRCFMPWRRPLSVEALADDGMDPHVAIAIPDLAVAAPKRPNDAGVLEVHKYAFEELHLSAAEAPLSEWVATASPAHVVTHT